MSNYKMSGSDLYEGSNRLGTLKGNDVYDNRSNRVGTVKGDQIYDSHSTKVAELRGDNLYDAHSNKIATLSDIRKTINNPMGGASLGALWLFFIR